MRGIIMADEKMIDRAEHVLYKTYNRFPVVFDHGKGVTLGIQKERNIWILEQVLLLWVWDTVMKSIQLQSRPRWIN